MEFISITLHGSNVKYLIVCLLLLSGCAKEVTWPASIKFQSLNNLEVEAITNSLKDLSQSTNRELFYFEERPNSFKITITKMDYQSNSKYLGRATITEGTCLVELNEVVLEDSYSSFFVPVLYHELGHCTGMGHNPNEGEIMYYVGSSIDFYSQDAFNRFFNEFVQFVNND